MTAAAPPGDRSIRIDGLRRTVADLRRSIDFYCDGLGFEPPRRAPASTATTVRLRLGGQHIDLVVADKGVRLADAAIAPDPRFQHAAIVTEDMDAAWKRAETHGAHVISRGGPQALPAHTGGVTAIKFCDPDGHPLELIRFPPGVGDPRWQVGSLVGPTLGIDHFALVVANIEDSTAFFVAQLHLQIAARDVNCGIEQDRLDGLDGVEVDVVSLEPRRGPRTPHLELLHYRHPTFVPPNDAPGVACVPRGDEIVCFGDGCPRASSRTTRLLDPDGHRFAIAMETRPWTH